MKLIFVDVEGKGPAAGLNNDKRFEWGAVDYDSWLKYRESDSYRFRHVRGEPYPFRTFHRIGANKENFHEFSLWLYESRADNYKMVTDNVAYDWQFINYYFHKFLKTNPFGHSARRIGDFAAGLERDFYAKQEWKKLRKTKHSHHPVEDALGNVEAFYELVKRCNQQRGMF